MLKMTNYLFDRLNRYVNKDNIIKYILLILVVFIFLIPIVRLVLMSVKIDDTWSFNNYSTLLSMNKTWRIIWNTIYISVTSTIISLVLGVFFAWVIAYTDIKYKNALQVLVILPFIIPSYIISLSWTQFTSPNGLLAKLVSSIFHIKLFSMYSYTGIILMMGISHAPLVFLFTVNVFRKIPQDLEFAARTCGNGRWKIFWKISFPLAMPGILSGGLISFLASIDNFGIVAFLGIPANIKVLSTYIYEEIIGFGPLAFSRGATLSVFLGLITIITALFQNILLKRTRSLDTDKEDFSIRISFGKYRKVIEMCLWIFLIAIIIIPILSMFSTSLINAYGQDFTLKNLTFKHYKFVLFDSSKTKRAILNSLILSGISTTICIVLGTIIAYYKVRKPSKIINLIETTVNIPYSIPGIVLSLSMIINWVEPIPGWKPGIYGTTKILIIAYVTRYLILQVKGSTTALVQINKSIEESAHASGASSINKWRKIIIPLITQGVMSGAFLVFVSAFTELTLSSLLWSSGSETVGVTVFNFQQGGYLNYATTFSSIVVAVILVGFILLKTLSSIKSENLTVNKNKSLI